MARIAPAVAEAVRVRAPRALPVVGRRAGLMGVLLAGRLRLTMEPARAGQPTG